MHHAIAGNCLLCTGDGQRSRGCSRLHGCRIRIAAGKPGAHAQGFTLLTGDKVKVVNAHHHFFAGLQRCDSIHVFSRLAGQLLVHADGELHAGGELTITDAVVATVGQAVNYLKHANLHGGGFILVNALHGKVTQPHKGGTHRV